MKTFPVVLLRGPSRTVESQPWENKLIGLSWRVIDYDDVNAKSRVGFWNLSDKQTFFGNASQLVAFRLMPLEPAFQKKLQAQWTSQVTDMGRRTVAFQDRSEGRITAWKWEFGDGATSTQQNPIHQYKQEGDFTVTLTVEGPDGKSRLAKVWQVFVK